MEIDWNVAPDWAIAHALHATAMGVKEVWVGEDKYQQFDHGRSFPYGGTIGAGSYHNPKRNQFAFETLRPADWNGEGLPPAGTECEAKNALSGEWIRVKVIDHQGSTQSAVCREIGTDKVWWSNSFRPIRTPEQIAAEERSAEVGAMLFDAGLTGSAFADDPEALAWAESLYDAGYRKTPTTAQ